MSSILGDVCEFLSKGKVGAERHPVSECVFSLGLCFKTRSRTSEQSDVFLFSFRDRELLLQRGRRSLFYSRRGKAILRLSALYLFQQ